jgi:hypothetical protein
MDSKLILEAADRAQMIFTAEQLSDGPQSQVTQHVFPQEGSPRVE